ncbi:MAG: hypothetical protein ACRELX_03730 [Longimicrobiales bacterium]
MLLGYGSQERDISLLVGQTASLDFELQETAVALQGIEVAIQREPVFEVQHNDVSTPVVSAEIVNLPLNRAGRRISISAEAFNIFNWDNISGFFGHQNDADGNPITNYGTPSGVFAPRQHSWDFATSSECWTPRRKGVRGRLRPGAPHFLLCSSRTQRRTTENRDGTAFAPDPHWIHTVAHGARSE